MLIWISHCREIAFTTRINIGTHRLRLALQTVPADLAYLSLLVLKYTRPFMIRV